MNPNEKPHGVAGMKGTGVVYPRVPAFLCGPIDREIELGAGHDANVVARSDSVIHVSAPEAMRIQPLAISGSSQHHQPQMRGAGHGFSPAVGVELGQDRGDVELDRVVRNPEPARDRLVRHAVRHRDEYFKLARG